MKFTHACPKCSSVDIVKVPGRATGYGAGSVIQIGATMFNVAPVSRYVCCNCGFLEDWVDLPEDIARVQTKYGARPGGGSGN